MNRYIPLLGIYSQGDNKSNTQFALYKDVHHSVGYRETGNTRALQ